jgi:methylase of polypeptide subunit release factors
MENLKNLSKTELFSKCKELNIKKCSKLNKDELVQLIEEKMSGQEPSASLTTSLTTSLTASKELSNTFVSHDVLNPNIEIKNMEGIEYLKTIANNSIDLILTDPPYIISKDSGMNDHYNNVKSNEENNIQYVKTEDEWKLYKTENNIETDENKTNFMKYGSIYGKKYCVKTDYGEWDTNFTMEKLDEFIGEYYKKLRKGGTLIIFFDLWKITTLKEMMEKYLMQF